MPNFPRVIAIAVVTLLTSVALVIAGGRVRTCRWGVSQVSVSGVRGSGLKNLVFDPRSIWIVG